MNRRLLPIVLIVALILTGSASGYNFGDAGFGYEHRAFDARSMALGGSAFGLSGSGYALFVNPALAAYPLQERALRVSVGYMVNRAEDRWSQPVHDSFESFLVYSDFSDNFSSGYAGSFEAVYRHRAAWPALSIAYGPLLNFDLEYEEEILGVSGQLRDSLISINRLQVKDELYCGALGISHSPVPYLSAGISVLLLRVSDSRQEIAAMQQIFYVADSTDVRKTLVRESSNATTFSIGAAIRPYNWVQVGIGYRGGFTWEREIRTPVDTVFIQDPYDPEYPTQSMPVLQGDLKYPPRLSLSLRLTPRSAVKGRLLLDVSYYPSEDQYSVPWSSIDPQTGDTLSGEYAVKMEERVVFSAGIEHEFYSGIPARFGFAYIPQAYDIREVITEISLGTGFSYDKLTFDFSGKVGRRKTRSISPFLNGGEVNGFKNKLEESNLSGMITVSYRAF